MALRVTLAGRTGVSVDGTVVAGNRLGRAARLALAYLTCERHRPVPRDELAEVLWGDELHASWEQMLRGVVFKLRGLLGAAGLDPASATLAAATAALDAGYAGEAQAQAQAAVAVEIAARQFAPGATGTRAEPFGTSNQFRPGNRWAYAGPVPNQLTVHSNAELDNAKRLALLAQADSTLWDDLPIVPLYQAPVLLAVRSASVNVEPNAGGGGAGAFWDVERWARRGQG